MVDRNNGRWSNLAPVMMTSVLLGVWTPHSVNAQESSPNGPTRIAPHVLARPGTLGIGRLVPDVMLTDITGESSRLSNLAGAVATVIVMRDAQCPQCRKYGPRIAELQQQYADRGVSFLYLNTGQVDTPADMAADAQRFSLRGMYIADASAQLARHLGVTSTTEVFVLDAARTLVYRGAIDDQYGIGYARDAPQQAFLVDALDAVLTNQRPAIEATTAPGCVLDYSDGFSESSDDITYHNRISRIMQRSCVSCHRSGAAGPFGLQEYTQVAGRRAMIRYVIDEQIMPPWHAADDGGPWINDRRLSDADRQAVLDWISADCPQGDPADGPIESAWPTGWSFTPDAVVQVPETFDVPAQGTVGYKYTYVKTNFPEDRWVTGVEFQPSQPQVVHHALAFIEEPQRADESRRDFRRRWQGGVRGYFAGLVPGQGATMYPEGFAKKLPAGAWLKLQLHYTPNGVAVTDELQIGFQFADGPPEHEVHTGSVATHDFEIKPGDANHKVVADQRLRTDMVIMSFAPHMHLRGKAYRYDMVTPDGSVQRLIDIPRYDFNWQTSYRLLEPLKVPAGSVLRATAWYDNSPGNPANPDATRTIGFGEQTWDEMMIGYFEWYRPSK